MLDGLRERIRVVGPGLVLAAAGIGAGDVVVASVSGLRFGTALLWAVVFTAGLKFVVTEALARWQFATGETMVRALVTRLSPGVSRVFAAYLLFWTFMVGASLSSACGMAGASLWPGISAPVWGAIHAALAAALVATNRFVVFQRVMKGLVAVMALSVLACALVAAPAWRSVLGGLTWPRIPADGGGRAVLALIGGIGGSLTVVCYGYWMRAAAWGGVRRLPTVRGDLRLAYGFTGLFGVALMVIAAGVAGSAAGGTGIALEVAARLQEVAGPAGRWVFLIGFWCTVFTAMLGVWQGVPQIYVDLVQAWRKQVAEPRGTSAPIVSDCGGTAVAAWDRRVEWAALFFLAGPPQVLLWFRQPVTVVVAFSIAGAFVMPFLAAVLLYLNNRRDWMGVLANGRLGNTALVFSLFVFGVVCCAEVIGALHS
ncbi:MAG: Nramp family divalent metal transporter [Verrucomicrobia bacterium]|nr:Nramp family divalent metal transporter [Verrucomicrobiota bacterium]